MPELSEPLLQNTYEDEGKLSMNIESKSDHIRDKIFHDDNDIIYTAKNRGECYKCFRLLWCGCCEPFATITTSLIREERWENCHRITDSMAFENVYDIRREQTCIWIILNNLPCCPCIDDIGTIVIYGKDESVTADGKGDEWKLRRISQSFDVFEDITGHLQMLHADWRKIGRKIGRKINQIK